MTIYELAAMPGPDHAGIAERLKTASPEHADDIRSLSTWAMLLETHLGLLTIRQLYRPEKPKKAVRAAMEAQS